MRRIKDGLNGPGGRGSDGVIMLWESRMVWDDGDAI